MNSKKNKTFRIGIDARLYGPVGKGLGRYTKEVVDNVIKIDKINEYVIFLCRENFDEFHILPEDTPRIKKILTDIRWYSLKEQFKFPGIIKNEKLDMIHFTHFNVPIFCPVKFIVTIHDLILTKYPTMRATTLGPVRYFLKNLLYRIVISTAVRRAKKIIVVSEFTKKDIIENFNASNDKIIVTYEGVSNLGRNENNESRFYDLQEILNKDKKILAKHNIENPYLLYVGNAYPHKNLEGLLKVFSEIKKKDICQASTAKLVLVGKDDYFYKKVKEYATTLGMSGQGISTDEVIFPGYVLDKDLEVMYRNAIAYIFPSFYEGFGLPPLEAMAHGCPVVSSDQASMPEILGPAALYFDPKDESEFSTKLIEIISNDGLKRELVKRGFEQVKKYSWDKCAGETLLIYKEALEVRS
jgi:glycosyltransferase involved in cell wall biosynthesis